MIIDISIKVLWNFWVISYLSYLATDGLSQNGKYGLGFLMNVLKRRAGNTINANNRIPNGDEEILYGSYSSNRDFIYRGSLFNVLHNGGHSLDIRRCLKPIADVASIFKSSCK